MSKEEIFELLKWLILELKNHDLAKNPQSIADHRAKSTYAQNEVDKLSSEDRNWLDKNISQWMKENVVRNQK